MWQSAIALVFCLGLAAASTKLTVYYESLCPYSAEFIKTQLGPVYKTDKNLLEVDLVPYGNARTVNNDGTWQFTCQHGPGECYGNKVHACALDLYPVDISTEFIVCAMASGDSSSDENLQECAASSKISWDSLEDCLSSGKADELHALYGDRTVAAKISGTPYIVLNDIYSEPLRSLAYYDLKNVVEFLSEEAECGECHIK